MICKDGHLHIPKNKIELSEDKSINSRIDTPNIRSINEDKDRNCSQQNEANRQKPIALDMKGQDTD